MVARWTEAEGGGGNCRIFEIMKEGVKVQGSINGSAHDHIAM